MILSHRPRGPRATHMPLVATLLAALPATLGSIVALTATWPSLAADTGQPEPPATPPVAPAAPAAPATPTTPAAPAAAAPEPMTAPAAAGPDSAPAPAAAASPDAAPATPGSATLPAPSEIETARLAAEAAGVTIIELKVGKGEPVRAGAYVRVHYTGWLKDAAKPDGKGKKFDSSRDRGEPFLFPLGAQRVIRGWDLGVAGMQRGGRRRLVIPETLAYGARGAGGVIPPHATLVFEIELIDFLAPLKPAP